jgi:hypothetical protein
LSANFSKKYLKLLSYLNYLAKLQQFAVELRYGAGLSLGIELDLDKDGEEGKLF